MIYLGRLAGKAKAKNDEKGFSRLFAVNFFCCLSKAKHQNETEGEKTLTKAHFSPAIQFELLTPCSHFSCLYHCSDVPITFSVVFAVSRCISSHPIMNSVKLLPLSIFVETADAVKVNCEGFKMLPSLVNSAGGLKGLSLFLSVFTPFDCLFISSTRGAAMKKIRRESVLETKNH